MTNITNCQKVLNNKKCTQHEKPPNQRFSLFSFVHKDLMGTSIIDATHFKTRKKKKNMV